jgi:ankyrin repeat protein
VSQPIMSAILSDQPNIARMLMDHGADVNTLNQDALLSLMIDKTWPIRHEDPENIGSVLDAVRERQVRFRKALEGKEEPLNEVEELSDDAQYLEGLNPASYKYWAARADLERAKHIVGAMKKDRKQEERSRSRQAKSARKRREEYEQVLVDLGNLEKSLLEAGARTFRQLHPEKEIKKEESHPYRNNYHNSPRKYEGPYKTQFTFLAPHLSDIMRDACLALFEAAWSGNEEMIKALTLAEWTPSVIGHEDMETVHSPINISYVDGRGFSPFAIAIIRGHTELADIILDIAMIQYQPGEHQPKYRYSLDQPEPVADDESEMSVDTEEDHVTVYKHLIDQKYTVESVAALQDTVESKVTPLQLLGQPAQMYCMMASYTDAQTLGLQIPREHLTTPWNAKFDKYSQGHLRAVLADAIPAQNNLFRYAIAKNDIALLKWLLEREERYINREEGRDPDAQIDRNINRDDFHLCMRHGRTEMLAEIIKQTGIRLPVKGLVEKSGIEVKETSMYYQGLTVYGRKRKDWADRSRGIIAHQQVSSDTPPLLDAVFYGNVEAIEYCLGDGPLRQYEEYAANQPNDAAIDALRQEKGGITKTISRWLNSRSQLAIHGVVMKIPSREEKDKDLELLISAMPHAIDGLNCYRLTPLHMAFQLKRLAAARSLIRAGANQAARDRDGENVIHLLMRDPGNHVSKKHSKHDYRAEVVEAFISLLDPTLLPELLLQRSTHDHGSHTPLSWFFHNCDNADSTEFLKIMLHYSQGKDLELMDGAGDYLLHYVVRRGVPWATKVIVEHNPALLFRENAVGLTPLEIAEITRLHHITANPPSISRYGTPACTSPLQLTHHKSDELPPPEETRQICQEAAKAHPHPRKLVSLVDATEVAKRLAEQRKTDKHSTPRAIVESRRYDWNQAGDKEATDEVMEWEHVAAREVPWDLLKYLKEKGCDVEIPKE